MWFVVGYHRKLVIVAPSKAWPSVGFSLAALGSLLRCLSSLPSWRIGCLCRRFDCRFAGLYWHYPASWDFRFGIHLVVRLMQTQLTHSAAFSCGSTCLATDGLCQASWRLNLESYQTWPCASAGVWSIRQQLDCSAHSQTRMSCLFLPFKASPVCCLSGNLRCRSWSG